MLFEHGETKYTVLHCGILIHFYCAKVCHIVLSFMFVLLSLLVVVVVVAVVVVVVAIFVGVLTPLKP